MTHQQDRFAEPGWWGVVVIVLIAALAAYLTLFVL